MMPWSEPGQVPLRELEQTNGWTQTPAVFRMQWILEALLKMNESPSSLDQPFKIVCIRRFGLEPELLEHIVRFVISCFIPAMEKCAIKWMVHDVFLAPVSVFNSQLCYEPRT